MYLPALLSRLARPTGSIAKSIRTAVKQEVSVCMNSHNSEAAAWSLSNPAARAIGESLMTFKYTWKSWSKLSHRWTVQNEWKMKNSFRSKWDNWQASRLAGNLLWKIFGWPYFWINQIMAIFMVPTSSFCKVDKCIYMYRTFLGTDQFSLILHST